MERSTPGISYLKLTVFASSPSGLVPVGTSLPECELVVLADPDDPYYPLAQEVSEEEQALLAHSLDKALACHPVFML